MQNIQASWQNLNKGTKIAIISFISIMILIIIIAIVIKLTPEPVYNSRVTVDNFSEISDLPNGYKRYIQDNIGNILKNSSAIDEAETADAIIRDGSYEEESSGSMIKSEFIIDLESLQYSFAVTVTWPAGTNLDQKITDPDVSISCPHYLDVIYTGTKCIAESPTAQLEHYLPHYDRIDGVKYAVIANQYTGKSYVDIEISACGNTELLNSALSSTKKWLKSIYLDPNDYDIKTTDICGGL